MRIDPPTLDGKPATEAVDTALTTEDLTDEQRAWTVNFLVTHLSVGMAQAERLVD